MTITSRKVCVVAEETKQEAKQIVTELQRLHDSGVPWHEVAILFRRIK